MMRLIQLVSVASALRVKFVNNLPSSGECAGHQLNLFVPNQQNVANQKSLIVDNDFSKDGGAGIQVDVMTWSYDFTKNDGSTYQCTCQDFGCNNPDNSSLNLRIKDDCSWEQPCGGREVPEEGAFCQPYYGYGLPTNGFTTVSVTKGSGDHDCVVTVSPQQNGNWELVCNTHIQEPQGCSTQIPASAAMYYKDLKSDIRSSLPDDLESSDSKSTTISPMQSESFGSSTTERPSQSSLPDDLESSDSKSTTISPMQSESFGSSTSERPSQTISNALHI